MKFPTFVLSAAALYAASVASRPVRRDVDPSLVPEFGLQSGLNPTGTGDCDGINGTNGQPIKIPCACPPDRDQFIQELNKNVAAGFVINNPSVHLSFPTDSSKASQSARLNAAAVTLQNLNGPGKGCPVASTTFSAQNAAINAESDNGTAAAPSSAASTPAASQAAPAAAAASPASDVPSAADITRLAPNLGFQSGVNPTGTGDCDGAVNGADGKPIKVPCACPPTQDVFIQHLIGDVQAGHAVNNPTVAVTFPTDDSKNSQLARITAASIALQNLNGPGKGCPIVSTTLQAQAKAIQDGTAAPAASSSAPATSQVAAAAPSAPATNQAATSGAPSAAEITSLAPDLGFQSGVNPTGTGDCDGAVNGADGKPIKVPCACPPSKDVFLQHLIADVQAGHAVNNPTVQVSFPTDNSVNSQLARITAASISLQNLNGPGKGCPIVSTTLQAQAKAIQAGTAAPASASPAPAKTSAAPAATSAVAAAAPASGAPSAADISRLAPDLGFQSGVNPTGTGDCDGAVNGANGQPIKIPCACPPARDDFIQHLVADVQAGHAVNNPSVQVSFPLDNSTQSQLARINAALISLQNLNGPGKGCPAVSTTLQAQQKALQG
ncbi:hypothetical protein ABKN59_006631 [Abortiporus biennis]